MCVPLFATYDKLSAESSESLRSTVRFHWNVYGGLYWSRRTGVAFWPLAAVGSMTGGRRKLCGNPLSQLKAGVIPLSAVANEAVVEKPNDGSPSPWLM